MRVLALTSLLLVSSCSSLIKSGVRTSAPLFVDSSNELTKENSWDFFRQSAPGNLKFLELMYLQDTKNDKLLGVLVKGYSGYAFAVPETLYLQDEILGVENSANRKEAIELYTRAFDYGLDYLAENGVERKDILSLDEKDLLEKLDDELREEDYVPALYFAQAWGSLINLQKDNVALVSQVPKVKVLFDFVCGKDKKIENNMCDLFYAQYEGSRPRMLGGNPAKGEELYLAGIAANPHHLLMRAAYMQFVLVPGGEQEKYEAQARDLNVELEKWGSLNRDSLEDTSEYRTDKSLNLYNAIAKKRFEIIEKNKKKIF